VLGSGAAACGGSSPRPAAAGAPAGTGKAAGKELAAFSRCVRDHGVEGFPELSGPRASVPGEIRSAGIDLRSPAVRSALRACRPVLRGR
jgi:hypothetical protein